METIATQPKTSWDLAQLTLTTQEWIKKARMKNVDVDEEVHLIVQTIIDAPCKEAGDLAEVTVVQQLMLRGMYCSRIIRKVAEAEIRCLAQAGREDPRMASQKWLIDDCEKWALSQLPSKWHLGDPSHTEHLYHKLSDKLKEMVTKIRSKL